MKKQEKQEVIDQVSELLASSSAVYVTNYSGINVEDISKLRREFREKGVEYLVVKNTLFKRALEQSGKFSELDGILVGMNGFIFAKEDAIAPAKIIQKYFDASQKLSLVGCSIEGQFYDGSRLKEIAALPGKPEIIASIISSVNAPASGIVGTLNAVLRNLVSVIDQISKKDAA
ncbi:50S ribosomal protein L10 [Candidatus Brocadiaceae bacterium]|nr:50S ribosomal protein L10 [Candidatus Brocadiaceae bacterium]